MDPLNKIENIIWSKRKFQVFDVIPFKYVKSSLFNQYAIMHLILFISLLIFSLKLNSSNHPSWIRITTLTGRKTQFRQVPLWLVSGVSPCSTLAPIWPSPNNLFRITRQTVGHESFWFQHGLVGRQFPICLLRFFHKSGRGINSRSKPSFTHDMAHLLGDINFGGDKQNANYLPCWVEGPYADHFVYLHEKMGLK